VVGVESAQEACRAFPTFAVLHAHDAHDGKHVLIL
jgi:hypothetical protein